ncbi:MAG: hypothetical protein ACUVQY_09705 [Thermoproteota archaeon]
MSRSRYLPSKEEAEINSVCMYMLLAKARTGGKHVQKPDDVDSIVLSLLDEKGREILSIAERLPQGD